MVHTAIDSLEDEELVLRICSGDQQAFRTIALRHGGRYRALAYRFVGNMPLAEDMVQEAFIKLWTHAAHFDRDRAKFTTWFHRVVVNKCLDETRKRKTVALPENFDAADETARADKQMENEAIAARLGIVLAGLSERQNTAVTLSYFDGLTNQEAADVMEMNIKAYESLLFRSRAVMRQSLLAEKSDLLSVFA